MPEPGTELVRAAMEEATGWYICRAGFVEVIRAVVLAAGHAAARPPQDEWQAFEIVELDQPLVERAAGLAVDRELRSLDALHLAAALVLPSDDLLFATWDRRLHEAARAEGLDLLPAAID